VKKSRASSLPLFLGFLAVSVIVVVCAGCKKEESTPPPPPAAPPAETASQLAERTRPLLTQYQIALRENGFWSPEAKTALIDGLRGDRDRYQSEENGPAALSIISRELSGLINEARTQERWELVMAGIEAYEVLEPNTVSFGRVKKMAQMQLSKPKVKLKGFFTDKARNDETYVWLELTDQETHETHTVKVREGEEFDGLKLVKIIGIKQGVTLEYLKIPGDVFDVKIDPK